MLNPTNTSLPRELRKAVRALITSNIQWNAWRVANLPIGEDSSDMSRLQIIQAANDMGISIAAVANTLPHLGAPIPAIATPMSVAAAAINDAIASSGETNVTAKAQTPTAATSFEGQDVDALLDEALAGVRDMLGSKLLDNLRASIAPLALAAAQGPRTVTEKEIVRETVTVTLDAQGVPVSAPVPAVALQGLRHAGDVFQGLKGRNAGGNTAVAASLPIPVCTGIAGEGDVPEHDTFYSWSPEVLTYLCAVAHMSASPDRAKRKRQSVLLFGPAGTGKTSAVATFAAATGRPFTRIAIDRTTEPMELIGQRLPSSDGATTFHEGALVTAMQVPWNVILIDEPSFLRPGSAASLQTILDTRYVVLKDDHNRRVDCAEGVMFIAADNTNLTGDETGRYKDTQDQNLALQDRFAHSVAVGYMSPATEAKTLSAATGIPQDCAAKLVEFAGLTRNGCANGLLTTGTSYRRLLAWGDALALGLGSQAAFNTSIANASAAQDRETIRQLEATLRHGDIDTLARGGTIAAPPVTGSATTDAGAAAAATFGDVPDIA